MQEALEYLAYLQERYTESGARSLSGHPVKVDYYHPWDEGKVAHSILIGMINSGIPSSEQAERTEQVMRMYKAAKEKYSRLEDLGTVLIIESLRDRMVTRFNQLSLALPGEIVFGTLPFGEVHAFYQRSPAGTPLILFNSGLFTFLNLLAKALATCFSLENGFKGKELVRRAQDLKSPGVSHASRRFILLMVAYVIEGRPDNAPTYALKEDSDRVKSVMLRDTAELFLFAHELGHAHIGVCGTTVVEQLGQHRPADTKPPANHLEELACDILAVQAIMGDPREDWYPRMDRFYGIEMILSVFGLMNELQPATATTSHPSAESRRENIQAYLAQKDASLGKEFALRSKVLRTAIEELWIGYRAFLEQYPPMPDDTRTR